MIEKISEASAVRSPQIAHDRLVDPTERLLRVIAELTEQMERENADLAAGLPASVAQDIDRKCELADLYADLYEELRAAYPDLLSYPGSLADRMTAAVLRLRAVADENLTRLQAATEASRRRIEAVLAAARSAGRAHATYGANGEIPLGARLAAFARDYHA